MKQRTHFWVGLAAAVLATLVTASYVIEDAILFTLGIPFVSIQFTLWLILFLFTPAWACFANFPDELDRLACAGLTEGPIDHCRSPLTHHPLTVGYWIVFLVVPASEYTKLLQLAVFFLPSKEQAYFTITSGFVFYVGSHLLLVWGSHLLLDALNPSGLPTGRKSVYAPRPLRHYAWKELRPNVRSWRLAHIRYDDEKWNRLLSIGAVFLTAVVIGNEVLRRIGWGLS